VVHGVDPGVCHAVACIQLTVLYIQRLLKESDMKTISHHSISAWMFGNMFIRRLM